MFKNKKEACDFITDWMTEQWVCLQNAPKLPQTSWLTSIDTSILFTGVTNLHTEPGGISQPHRKG